MAQRLLLGRFLTSVISRKPPQGVWASLTSKTLQTPQYNAGGLTVMPSPARTVHTTRVCLTTFNVQDGPDFQDRVVNSETPVVVDFHAQRVPAPQPRRDRSRTLQCDPRPLTQNQKKVLE
uniref:Thioredoxin 2 n=1 Tax=Mus musculus TaxID=10090 RepID=Q3TUS3_MOUSE|nr:unnamed protein product [Mus musculus]